MKLREVFKPFEAGERRSSLCNLTLQSFPFLSSSITRHDYLLFLGTEPYMLVSHLTTRPASEISKLVHSFRRRHDIVSLLMQPFGLS